MPDQDTTQDISIAVLQEKLKNLEALTKTSLAKIKVLEEDKDRALRWGIILLGTAVISLGTWIFNHIIFMDKAVHP
jgi:hypothetical protein